ncbi:hypothetical protein ZWY2020_055090 [Hordeum vulgare]|nr:hypothetical protein ZWY2020_055090 [Hordeum vulgare]
MEVFCSAVVGELFSRFMSSMIKRCNESMTACEKLEHLKAALLRAHTIVEEAASRRVTNGAMLLQLSVLMEAMYRGQYVLDTFKYQHRAIIGDAGADDQETLPQLTTFGPTAGKRRRWLSRSPAMDDLRDVLSGLESTIADMDEFLVFLGSYPRMFCQPYTTYLFVDNCMFGRQAELRRVIGFLLRKEPEPEPERSSTTGLDVLPVIGRRGAGKRTLVEHACSDERVRACFPVIIRICKEDLEGTTSMAFCKHQKNFQDGSCKTLVIVEYDDEASWTKLYDFCSSASCIASGSKIIVTSATEAGAAVARLGTTVPIRLDYLSPEEYWYFFKARAFGATNPNDQRELASVAMAVVAELRCSFMYANMYGGLMRNNMDARFWRGLLRCLRGHMRRHLSICGDNPMDLIGNNRPSYLHPIHGKGGAGGVYLLYNYRSTAAERVDTLPGVSVQDLIVGRGVPDDERFEVLGWRSHIAPYYCYLASCEKRRTRQGSPLKRTMRT